jgi:hypothetical protein
MGTNQYSSAVSADVVQALSKLSQADRMLANLNSMLSVVTSNNSLKEAQSEATAQIKQGWSDAIGQFAVGLMQMASGAVAMGSAMNYLSSMSDGDGIDEEIRNKQEEIAKHNKPGNTSFEDKENETAKAQKDAHKADGKKLQEDLDGLNEKKAKNEKDQKKLEAKMKQSAGIEGIMNGVGQMSQAASKEYSAEQMAKAIIYRALNGMMGTQSQQFGSQADHFANEMNKPAEQLAQMAQTANK